MSKVRKVYHLRKTTNIRPTAQQHEESKEQEFKEQEEQKNNSFISKNQSILSQNTKEFKQTNPRRTIEEYPPQDQYLVDGSELIIDSLHLNFEAKLNDICQKELKVRNVGSSAVYVQWVFKHRPKINNSAVQDMKIKFYSHYESSVIKPGEERSFIFSFMSEFAGYFTQEIELKCEPSLHTNIPYIKLTGKAFIDDEWKDERLHFMNDLNNEMLSQQVSQILEDIINQVKMPDPPKPDYSDLRIAEEEFEQVNKSQRLFFSLEIHSWFCELYQQVCEKQHIQDSCWDQSVLSLKSLIELASNVDEVEKKCYLDRLQHYTYLSLKPQPNKSKLYSTVYEFVSSAAFRLGGEYVDTVRKQLDMWEIPFREPLETDTPEELKIKKDQIDKIKAEWVKRAKKKKWGEEEEKQLVNDYKNKVQKKVTDNILSRFTNFEDGAEFIKAKQSMKSDKFDVKQYHQFLQRLKTVKQASLEGKKVMIKFNLKLKENCEEKLKELEDYLLKRQEEEKRLDQEKKSQDGSLKKKKAAPKTKKKGQKEQEEQKPLFFDFMTILDEEYWNGFLETFKTVQQKQPFLILLSCSYGPKSGRFNKEYSVKFLLEHLKSIQNSIEFLPHDQFLGLGKRIEDESLSEGSILFLQNLNFLPEEVTQEQMVTNNEETKVITYSKRKLLHCEIREYLDQVEQFVDVLVSEDRFNETSGFSTYLNKERIVGHLWWKYIGLSMRALHSTIIFGQDFTPVNYQFLKRALTISQQIILTGKIGLKFFMIQHSLDQFCGEKISSSEKSALKQILECDKSNEVQKLVIPVDFVLQKVIEDKRSYVEFRSGQEEHGDLNGCLVVDIGDETVRQVNGIKRGTVFLIGETSVKSRDSNVASNSLQSILRYFYSIQELKRLRHAQEANTSNGINYQDDFVLYLVGLQERLIETIQLKEKKIKKIPQEAEEAEEGNVEAEEEAEDEENEKKKIDLIADFKLASASCMCRLIEGAFSIGLKDISKYPLQLDD